VGLTIEIGRVRGYIHSNDCNMSGARLPDRSQSHDDTEGDRCRSNSFVPTTKLQGATVRLDVGQCRGAGRHQRGGLAQRAAVIAVVYTAIALLVLIAVPGPAAVVHACRRLTVAHFHRLLVHGRSCRSA